MIRRQRVRPGVYLIMVMVFFLSMTTGVQAQGEGVLVMEFKGTVAPILLNYVERSIARAETIGAEAIILKLDTPGGSVATMQEITQRILASPVPIIVYVSPRGAHASSAGTLITLAGHLAAMAPGTTIGAASPVTGEGEDLPDTLKAKQVNTLVTDAQNLARHRGEAAVEWAGKAVSEAAAASDEEALALGVVDVIASDVGDLLQQLDGREVFVLEQPRTLQLVGQPVLPFPMDPVEQFFNIVVNPAIAAILLTIGVQALLIELSSPGGWVAGFIGVASLLLAFYSLGALDANWLGLGLIALAFILFFLELKAPTFGALALAGIVSFIAGSAVLFSTPTTSVPWSTIITLALATAAFFAFAMAKIVQIQQRPATTGGEGLIGAVGVARTTLEPEGEILVWGELWKAEIGGGSVQEGERVRVLAREGFRLMVEKITPSQM